MAEKGVNAGMRISPVRHYVTCSLCHISALCVEVRGLPRKLGPYPDKSGQQPASRVP